jgi:predicted nucleotidyltransferase
MSGHFLQRGEPAVADKWLRAEMALRCGVDVVVELPFPFACASAPAFARGAVQCLDALGVESLCFGSESGNLEDLQRCAALLDERADEVAQGTAELLRQGVSFPDARARIFADLTGLAVDAVPMRQPNNILGIEYLRALRQTGSVMRPLTISRLGAGYHDRTAAGGIASASGIRGRLAADEPVDDLLPAPAAALLRRWLAARLQPDDDLLHRLVLAQIFRGRDYLRTLCQVENGLDGRLASAAVDSGGWQELVAAVKARQFTRTRIQRLLLYVLLDVQAGLMDRLQAAGPRYLRLLGCSARGRRYLGAVRRRRRLPLLINLSRVYAQFKRAYGADSEDFRLALAMLDLDVRATRTYTLLLPGWSGGSRDLDFSREALYIDHPDEI